MTTTSRNWKIGAGVVFYALLIWFLVRYLANTNWDQLARLDFSPKYLLAAVPLSLLPRFLQPIAWRQLIRGYGDVTPPFVQIARVYALSWMGRYIPGKVAWIGAKVVLGREYGIRATTLASTAVAEAMLQLATGLALSFLLMAVWGDIRALEEEVWLLSAVTLAILSVLLLPPVFNALTAHARALAKVPEDVETIGLSATTLLESGMLYMAIHALSSLPIYLVVKAMYPALTASLIPEITAAFLLAGAMGTLAIFAPSGLGVREGILVVLLGLLIPKHVAVVAVIVLRLWSIAMDLTYYGLAILLDRSRPLPGGRRVTQAQ